MAKGRKKKVSEILDEVIDEQMDQQDPRPAKASKDSSKDYANHPKFSKFKNIKGENQND